MSNDDRPKIWGQLDPTVYTYFFRKIFAGDRGIKQQLINHFFTALYEECRRQQIKAEWDPESGKQIETLMNSINFHAHRPGCAAHPSAEHQA